MNDLRRLEAPLRAWRNFRDVAQASQNLAAARALQWAELARRAEQHLGWCQIAGNASCEDSSSCATKAPRQVVLAIGTDLGLCGGFNRHVAQRCRASDLPSNGFDAAIIVGSRLAAFGVFPGATLLPCPSSLAAAQTLSAQIEDLLDRSPGSPDTQLMIVLATSVSSDGHPRVQVYTDPPTAEQVVAHAHARIDRRSPAQLGSAQEFRRRARTLIRHARIFAALARSVTTEHETRWRTMSRAHEAAQRGIDEQQANLRRVRQELITQEMLDARRGGPKSNQRNRHHESTQHPRLSRR